MNIGCNLSLFQCFSVSFLIRRNQEEKKKRIFFVLFCPACKIEIVHIFKPRDTWSWKSFSNMQIANHKRKKNKHIYIATSRIIRIIHATFRMSFAIVIYKKMENATNLIGQEIWFDFFLHFSFWFRFYSIQYLKVEK